MGKGPKLTEREQVARAIGRSRKAVTTYLKLGPQYNRKNPGGRPRILSTRFEEIPKIKILQWPVKGSDLSPIENVWGEIVNKLKKREITKNANELWDLILDTWNEISNDTAYFINLYNSIPSRIQDVHEKNGLWSKY
ncbi:hypothetical protein B4U79_02102 [Dinothrombium tinctorium]|uniref:Tc1-like transposase DDE domain-containing protein n=1 Tax=Dinothrombium tinctorium TaxID=1965070 RepID=A0A443QUN4_9ACAR|nr:hypothetical protein B4U79_02102 [Dinothrombium tinctorium]